MKTLFLKQLKSGNYKISNASDHSISFTQEDEFVKWYNENINGYSLRKKSYGSRIIKATYRLSQTYFSLPFYNKKAALEVIKFNEKRRS